MKDLNISKGRIIGDILLCSGIVSMLGAFNISYRDNCVEYWIGKLKENNISFLENFTITDIMVD